MHNSILYLSPQGEVMGTHRKICTTIHERFFHTAGDGGDNLRAVFSTELGKIGGSICGEHSQLLQVYNWIMQGIQIHCSLWPGEKGLEGVIDLQTRSLCYNAHAFGILASGYIPDKDYPKNFYKNCRFNVPGGFRGGSGVVNPAGEYIAGPVYDRETIVYGDIDLSENYKNRVGVNLTGIYSRWDLFNINVQQEPYEPVVPAKRPDSESKQISNLEARINQLEQQIAMLSHDKEKESNDKAMS